MEQWSARTISGTTISGSSTVVMVGDTEVEVGDRVQYGWRNWREMSGLVL